MAGDEKISSHTSNFSFLFFLKKEKFSRVVLCLIDGADLNLKASMGEGGKVRR